MTTPDVPLRMELRFELPGTPEQVWDAIATSGGISSWFLPTDVEERVGGAIVTHMGEEDSPGTVTGWEPPRRFAYEEPAWAGLAGQHAAPVTPLATELLVEAASGGTCVVRVVTSAFGTGAEWEREFFTEMERGWTPFFEHLRVYLAHFPGQRAAVLEEAVDVPGTAAEVWATMRRELGVERAGQAVELHGLRGEVDRLGEIELLVRLTGAHPGFFALYSYDTGDGTAMTGVRAYLFSEDASTAVERERAAWRSWLEGLAASVG